MDCDESFNDFKEAKIIPTRRNNLPPRQKKKRKKRPADVISQSGKKTTETVNEFIIIESESQPSKNEAKICPYWTVPIDVENSTPVPASAEVVDHVAYLPNVNESSCSDAMAITTVTEVVDPVAYLPNVNESSCDAMSIATVTEIVDPVACLPNVNESSCSDVMDIATVTEDRCLNIDARSNSIGGGSVNDHSNWMCLVCNMSIPLDIRAAHLQNCISSYRHEQAAVVSDGKDQVPSSISCSICSMDISHFSFDERCEHANRCLDSDVREAVENTPQSTVLTECPLCLKECQTLVGRMAHIKKCSQSKEIGFQGVMAALQLHQKHAMERMALGLPPIAPKPVEKKNNEKLPKKIVRKPKNQADADIQLAKALSLSFQEEENRKDLLSLNEAELNSLGMPKRDSSASWPLRAPGEQERPSRRKKKNANKPVPLLLLRTDEERQKLFEQRISDILAPQCLMEETEIDATSDLKTCPLWRLCGLAEHKMTYYVEDINGFIVPEEIEAGSKLQNLSQIHGHRIYTQQPCDFTFSSSQDTKLEQMESSRLKINEIPSTQEMIDIIVDVDEANIEASRLSPSSTPLLGSASAVDQKDGFFCDVRDGGLDGNPVMESLEKLVGNEWMSDVDILMSDGSVIPAHTFLLNLSCPALRSMLNSAFCPEGRKTLNWHDVSTEAALYFLHYVYTGVRTWPCALKEELENLFLRCDMKECCSNVPNAAASKGTNDGEILEEQKEPEESERTTSSCLLDCSSEERCNSSTGIQEQITSLSCDSKVTSNNVLKNANPSLSTSTMDMSISKDVELVSDEKDYCTTPVHVATTHLETLVDDPNSPDLFACEAGEYTTMTTHIDAFDGTTRCLSPAYEKSLSEVDGSDGDTTVELCPNDVNANCEIDSCSPKSCKEQSFCSAINNDNNDSMQGLKTEVSVPGDIDVSIVSHCNGEASALEPIQNNHLTESLCIQVGPCTPPTSVQWSPRNWLSSSFGSPASNKKSREPQSTHFHSTPSSSRKGCESFVKHSCISTARKKLEDSYCSSFQVHGTKDEPLSSEVGDDCQFLPLPKTSAERSFQLVVLSSDEDTIEATVAHSKVERENVGKEFNFEVEDKKSSQFAFNDLSSDDESKLVPLHMRIKNRVSAEDACTTLSEPQVLQGQDLVDSSDDSLIIQSQRLPPKNLRRPNTKITSKNSNNGPKGDTCATPDFKGIADGFPEIKAQTSDSPITPMPDYKAMFTPDIKMALKKYGVRALPKKKAVAILTHIYDETHPWVDSNGCFADLIQPNDTTSQPSPKKRKRKAEASSVLNKKSKTKPSEAIGALKESSSEAREENLLISDHTSSQTSSISDSSDVLEESLLTLIEDDDADTCSQATASNAREQIRALILADHQLHSKVLTYEPLNLNEFHTGLKENGIKISATQLMDYLDEQCITFTLPRSEKFKRKQQTRNQKFRKRMIATGSSQPNC